MQQRDPAIPTLQQQERYLEEKRTVSGLETNFRIFNDFLRKKTSGYATVTIFLLIAFAHHFLSTIRQYKMQIDYHYSTEETVINQLINACQYVDVQGLMNTDETLSYIMIAVSLHLTLGTSLLYSLILILGINYKARKKFIGKCFSSQCILYIWLFHFPCMTTFFEYLNCGSKCEYNEVRIILSCFVALGLVCGVCNIVSLTFFYHNNSDNKKDCFNTENYYYLALYQVYRVVLALLVAIKSQDYSFLWFFMIINFVSLLYFLISACLGSGYLAFATNYSRKCFILLLTITFSQSIAMIIDELYRYNRETKKSENFALFFTTNLFFVVVAIIYNFKTTKCTQIEYDISKLNQEQLARQVHYVITMLNTSNTDVTIDVFFKGILQRHNEFQCQHTIIQGEGRCFCKKKKVFDPKKKKDFKVDEWISYKAVFMKFLIKSWLETYLQAQENAYSIQILYARFMFSKMRNHSIALHILSDLEKRFSFILDRYRAFQLKFSIQKYVKHLNTDSYKGRLEVENALFVEDQIDQIKNNIMEILKQNTQFWQHLQQSTIDLEELDNLLIQQFQKIQSTKQLWISITIYLDYKKKWKFYYAWFTLYILNKKIKNRILDNFQGLQVNENDIFSEELQENNVDEDIASIKSGQQNIEQDKIEIKSKKIVFDKKACIIQCSDDSLILKVNKQFTRIFGYRKEETIKILNLSQLMPDVYSKVHGSIIQDYKQSGKMSALYSQKKIYCIHKSGYMFTAWKFVKLYVDLNGYSQFVAMIRPTDMNNEKKHDFIIINGDWEVNGMTHNLHQTLHLDSSLFQKKNSANLFINLLLMAPKLIQYSKIRSFINEHRDLKIFGMVRNEQIRQKIQQDKQLEPQSSGNSQVQLNPVIKVNEMINSNSLKVGLSKPGVLYSDMDITSKLFIPQQSLDVPQQPSQTQEKNSDKVFLAQSSGLSDKNDFTEFQHQINQYSQMQVGLAEEIQKQAQQKIQEELNEQFQTNYQRIQTNKHEHSDSEAELSNDEMMNLQGGKSKQRPQSILEGKVENGEQITFRLQITDNLQQACQYYTTMKYKLYQIRRAEDEQLKHQEVQDQNKQKKEKVLVKQGTQQREFKKKARLMFQKAAERQRMSEDRNYYELLLELYQKFIQEGKKKNQFKVVCTIAFYKIREERVGIIKILGLSEIQKIQRRRDAARRQSYLLPFSKEFQKLNSKLSNTNNLQQQSKQFPSLTSEADSKVVSPIGAATKKISSKNNGLGYQLQSEEQQLDDADDKDMLLDSKGMQKIINWETFQNQFKMQQGTQSFSLNVLDNIFRKEDNNKPRKLLVKISYLTWFLRLMFLSIITLNIITYFLKPFTEFGPIKNQAQRIFELSQMQTYLIEAYDTVLDVLLYKNTDVTSLSYRGQKFASELEFYTFYQSQIDVGYLFIKAQINDINQQETFLDNSIFYADPILDESITGQINVSLTLDHKDFFTKFIMLQHQIQQMDPLELEKLDSLDPGVKFIRFITLPYLYDQLNQAVLSLQDILLSRSSSMSNFIVIILILEGSIFVVGFFGLLIIILWICQTYKAVLKIFILIKKNDLNKIVKQQRFIEQQFKYLVCKDDEITGLLKRNEYQRMNSNASRHQFQQQQNFLLINEGEEQNINKKKDKNIIEKKLLRKLTLKLSLSYIVLVIFAASASLAFFLILKGASDQIGTLIHCGKTAIQDFSDSQLILVSVKERYFNESNYVNVYLPELGDMMLNFLTDIKQTPSIENPNYGLFYDSFQKMYFSNLCQILLDRAIIDSTTYEDCTQLLLGKLEDGVVAFNQYYASNTEDYILNQESRFGYIDSDQIWAYNQAVDYIKSAYRGLLTYWSEDLSNYINDNSAVILVLLIVMLIFQLIVFLTIAEMYLVNELNGTFSFYRQVYKSYMPNDIIQKEKIIRAQLIRYNIIKR